MLRSYWIPTLGLLVCLAGCGDEPAPAPSPEPLEPAAAERPAPAPAASDAASNASPRIDSISFEPDEPVLGDTVRAVVDISDSDGDTVWRDYSWTIDGEPVGRNAAEIRLDGPAFARGKTLALSVVARDGQAQDHDSAEVELANALPRLLSVEVEPSGDLHSGVPITLRPNARDADGDDLSFRYEWKVDGRPVRTNGPVLETERLRRGNTVQAWVFVTDGHDESEPFETPRLTLANSPPEVVSHPPETSPDGGFRYRVQARDPDGDRNLRFKLENEPEGMTIDPIRGSVVWVPGTDQDGEYRVSVIVDDRKGGETRHVIELNVADPGEPPPPASLAQ